MKITDKTQQNAFFSLQVLWKCESADKHSTQCTNCSMNCSENSGPSLFPFVCSSFRLAAKEALLKFWQQSWIRVSVVRSIWIFNNICNCLMKAWMQHFCKNEKHWSWSFCSEKSQHFCGNMAVEPDFEECDAGHQNADNPDPCCSTDCKLKAGAVCRFDNSVWKNARTNKTSPAFFAFRFHVFNISAQKPEKEKKIQFSFSTGRKKIFFWNVHVSVTQIQLVAPIVSSLLAINSVSSPIRTTQPAGGTPFARILSWQARIAHRITMQQNQTGILFGCYGPFWLGPLHWNMKKWLLHLESKTKRPHGLQTHQKREDHDCLAFWQPLARCLEDFVQLAQMQPANPTEHPALTGKWILFFYAIHIHCPIPNEKKKLTTVPVCSRGTCFNGKCVPFCEYQGLLSCACDTGKWLATRF